MSNLGARKIPELPETFWAYFAGFIDGEGSIMLCQQKYPRMVVANTHKPTLDYFLTQIGTGSILAQDKGKKPTYQYVMPPNACRAILPKIVPYLIQKKRKGELLIEYLHLNTIAGNQTRSEEDKTRIEKLRQEFLSIAGRQ